MEQFNLLIVTLVVILVISLVISLMKINRQKRLIIFLDSAEKNSVSIKSTRFLASLGIKNLERYGYKLLIFYQKIFSLTTIMYLPGMVNKISQYINRLNRLKDSKEKKYLIHIFRQAILNCESESLAFIIYYSAKIKCQDRNGDGKIIENFLLENKNAITLHVKDVDLVIYKINFYEQNESAIIGDCRKEIKKELEQIIKKIKEPL